MKLTPRLQLIADNVQYNTVADIGTDHGKIPVYLAKNKNSKVVASDINEGPVNACRKNVMLNNVSDMVCCRIGAGLSTISENEAESIIIAGMGGELISNILDAHKSIAFSAKELLLQPMNGIDKLRRYLYENSFLITDEFLVNEGRRIYTLIKAKKGEMTLKDETDLEISPILEKKGGELFRQFIIKLKEKNNKIYNAITDSKIQDPERIRYITLLIERLNKYDF